MEGNIYEQYMEWFVSQEFYIDYMANFPEPLNNPAFASAVVLIAAFMLVTSVVGYVKSWMFHRKMVKKARELEELKANQRLEDAKKEQERKRERESESDSMRDLMKQYMEFMTMVHAQNAMGQMMSLKNMTFDQWQMQMYKQQANAVISPSSQKELEEKYNTDVMTGLLNRNAYERDIIDLDVSKVGIITIDANNLKETNDTKGHSAGDNFIKSIASAIVSIWGKERSYRIGDDEFAVIIEGVKEKVTRKNIEIFRELVSDDGYSAAVGYADASNVKGKATIEKIQKASDQEMYLDKNSYKKAIEDKQVLLEEEARLAEEKRIREEQEAAEKACAEEARIEAEKIEYARKEAEKKQAEEQARIEEEKRKAEEAARIEAENAELARKAAEQKAKELAEAEAKKKTEEALKEQARQEESRRIEKAKQEALEAQKIRQEEQRLKEKEAKEKEQTTLTAVPEIEIEEPVANLAEENINTDSLPEIIEKDIEPAEEPADDIAPEEEELEGYIPAELEEDDAFTDEQQSDFAKLVAMMASSTKQKEKLDNYNQQKSEITKKNMRTLDNQIASEMEDKSGGSCKRKDSGDEELERKKKEALARIEAEKNQPKKKSLFGRK